MFEFLIRTNKEQQFMLDIYKLFQGKGEHKIKYTNEGVKYWFKIEFKDNEIDIEIEDITNNLDYNKGLKELKDKILGE